MRFVQFSYYKTTNRTASCGVCIVTCDAMQLCHFAGGFGAIFAIFAVCAV